MDVPEHAYWLLQTDVMPLDKANIWHELAKAAVYWEPYPLSLLRLRFQVKCTAQMVLIVSPQPDLLLTQINTICCSAFHLEPQT